MVQNRKFLIFEANEIPFRVIDRFIERYPRSTVANYLQYCSQLITYDASIERGRTPQPTFSWPSVHRGVDESVHGIYHFNQDLTELDQQYPPIWKILVNNGISIGIFGVFHSYGSFPTSYEKRDPYAFYVPDVFSPDAKAYPQYLCQFQAYTLAMTRASARNVSPNVRWKDALEVLRNSLELGIKPFTIWQIIGQLAHEKVHPWVQTRRRNHQVNLAFDVFIHQLAKNKPDYGVFFANNIASAMHRYWAATFPEDFDICNVDQEWIARYCSEIDYSVKTFDNCFARLIQFVEQHPDYKLIIMSGIGQAARASEYFNTELYITNWSRFMEALGLEGDTWRVLPAMIPMFNVIVYETSRDKFRLALENLLIDGENVDFREHDNGMFSMCLGQANMSDRCIKFRGKVGEINEFGMENVKIDDRSSRSGYHIPTGSLLIYDPLIKQVKSQNRPKISTLDICPSILNNFNLNIPSYMQGNILNDIF